MYSTFQVLDNINHQARFLSHLLWKYRAIIGNIFNKFIIYSCSYNFTKYKEKKYLTRIHCLSRFLIYVFFYLVYEAIGTAATPGLLCQPRVIVKIIVEKKMECRLAGEIQVLGENLPQRHFCPSQTPTWPDQGLNPGRRGGKPATNRLSYGAA
jgi:hypothetical protein